MGVLHSPSILLNILLGEADDYLPLGEFNYIIRSSLYSCKNIIKNCLFWNKILIEIFKDKLYLNKDILYFIKKLYYFEKIKKEIEFYKEIIYEILKLVANKVNKKVLINSTKRPYYLYILRKIFIEFIIIYLIRDSRGVVWSYCNSKCISYTSKFRAIHHPLTIIKLWLKINLQIECIKLLYKN